MAEKKEDSGSTSEAPETGKRAGQQTDPEKGSFGAVTLLGDPAREALVENFKSIVKCIILNIDKGHLPSVKLLVDLAALVIAGHDVPAEAYESLAGVLNRQLQGIGNAVVVEGETSVVEAEPDLPDAVVV